MVQTFLKNRISLTSAKKLNGLIGKLEELIGTRFENETTQERFNGMGPIIKTELKHKVNEWIQDTSNPILCREIGKTNTGRITPLLQFYVLIKQVVGIEKDLFTNTPNKS